MRPENRRGPMTHRVLIERKPDPTLTISSCVRSTAREVNLITALAALVGWSVAVLVQPIAFAQSNSRSAGFRADRMLVKPKPNTDLTALHARLGTTVLRSFPGIGNLQVLQLSAGADVRTLLSAFQQSGLVEYAEPDFIVQAALEPNDFRYADGSLWALHNTGIYGGTSGADIDAPNGWDIQNTAANIVVAVIDTGARYTHEDLAANMLVNPGESGRDFLGLDKSSNGAKIINASWGDYTSAPYNGILSDHDNPAHWNALHDAIASVRNAGILFVAACGNDGTDNDAHPLYPASYTDLDNIIAVAATDRTDAKTAFSNYGANTVHLGAPGAAVFSCWNGSDSDYRYLDGTSMATAHVVGACALVWAHYSSDSYAQVRSRVLSGVEPLPSLAGISVSGGRLNLYQALGSSSPPALPVVTVIATDASASEAGPDPVTFTVSRSGSTALALTVYYTLAGTAQNGVDYQTLPGSVRIPAGASSATVTVTPIDDNRIEGDETVVLTPSSSPGYTAGSPGSATIVIHDNDLPLPLPFTVSPISGT